MDLYGLSRSKSLRLQFWNWIHCSFWLPPPSNIVVPSNLVNTLFDTIFFNTDGHTIIYTWSSLFLITCVSFICWKCDGFYFKYFFFERILKTFNYTDASCIVTLISKSVHVYQHVSLRPSNKNNFLKKDWKKLAILDYAVRSRQQKVVCITIFFIYLKKSSIVLYSFLLYQCFNCTKIDLEISTLIIA